MAGETIIARESRVNPVNAVASYNTRTTRAFRTATSYVNDAVIRRGVNLASQYANTSPFSPSQTGPRNEAEQRNLERINRAVQNMRRRNRGLYF